MKPSDDALLSSSLTPVEMRPDQATSLMKSSGLKFLYRSPEDDDPGYALLPSEWVQPNQAVIDQALIITPITAVRDEASNQIFSDLDRVGNSLKEGYPQSEVDAWPTKDAAARKVLAGTATPEEAQILQSEADASGETLDAIARKVAANGDFYKKAIGSLTGIRTKADADLAKASSQAQVDKIIKDTRLALAQVEKDAEKAKGK